MTATGDAAHLLDAHPNARVVTLDFFDTLVTRSLAQPSHVFALMEQRFVDAHGDSWRGFAGVRVSAEHALRVRLAAAGETRDVTHDEILDEVARAMALNPADVAMLRAAERDCEVELARIVPFGREVAHEARSRGLRVAIVSDNYMPSAHIVAMAHAAGETWVADGDVFVSCEHGAMKQNGTLWPLVVTMLNVPAPAILHVGDHEVPDREQPSRHGIRCHIDPVSSRSHRHPMNTCPAVLPFSRIEAEQRDRGFVSAVDPASALGEGLVAMMVAGQVKDVMSVVASREVAGVHFAARDGWMAHSVWNDLRRDTHPGLPAASYLSFSRSVIGRASITHVDEQVAVRFIDEHERLTPRRLSARFGCDIECAVPPDREMDSSTARDTMMRNADRIVAASAGLRHRVVGHLRANGVLAPGHHVVVDLGWRASTVADLAEIVHEASDGGATIEGRFLGLYWDATMNRVRVPVHGYAMDDLGPLDDNIRLLGAVRLFEFLVTAPHGSVVDFLDEEHGFAPVHAPLLDSASRDGCFVSRVLDAATASAGRILRGTHASAVTADDVTPESVWAAMMQVAHTPRHDELDALREHAHVASVDHADAGLGLIAEPPRWASTVPVQWYGRIYDDTMKTRWFQGSLRQWERTPAARDFAAGVVRLWPFMGPVWCDPT